MLAAPRNKHPNTHMRKMPEDLRQATHEDVHDVLHGHMFTLLDWAFYLIYKGGIAIKMAEATTKKMLLQKSWIFCQTRRSLGLPQ